MPLPVLSVFLDTQEPRILLDRLALLTDGRDWELEASSPDVGLDPITKTGMLLPLPYTEQWGTGPATGQYARHKKANYTLTTPAKWKDFSLGFDGNNYLQSVDINEEVYTNTSFDRNRPVYLSWFAYNSGGESFVQLECGWGRDTDADVRLRFTSDGKVECYRNGVKLATGSITGKQKYPQPLGPQGSDTGSQDRQFAQNIVNVVMIPCRQRELLLLSNQGGGCNFLFEDLDPNEEIPTITGAGPFWWYVPEGQASVQFAPLKFKTSGYIVSSVKQFRYPPPEDSEFTFYGNTDDPGYGSGEVFASLVEEDGTTEFEPDGALDTVRIRIDLTGDSDSTPYLYGATVTLEPSTANTPAANIPLANYMVSASYTVGEGPADVKFDVTLQNPATLEVASGASVRTIGNRPIRAYVGTVPIFTGRTDAPKWEESYSDNSRRLTLPGRDLWKALETYRIQDPLPINRMYLHEAFEFFAMMPGFPFSMMDVEEMDLILPAVGQESEGEHSLLPEVGDTPADWIIKLWETFCGDYFVGWVPTAAGPKFRVASPASIGTTPVATIYGTVQAAYNALIAGGASAADAHALAPRYVYRTYRETHLEPEANDITVVGRHPRTGTALIAHWADVVSQDMTLAPGDRPANWLGEPRRYGLVEPQVITTQEMANYALAVLVNRLPKVRRMGEWECDLLGKLDGAMVWRGDPVRLDGIGIFRVNTLSADDLSREHAASWVGDQDMVWRPTLYTGEYIGA
jgi:hypothetical protein